MKSEPSIVFPPFRLDLLNCQLWRGTKRLVVRPKTIEVLGYLVDNAGRVVTKAELLQALWPGAYGSEGLPKGRIRELRAVLGDAAESPRFIETVGRQGYRFIAPLSTTLPVSSSKFQVQSSPSALVGRDAELAQLHGCLAQAQRGAQQIVFVTGEPGIGKTTLVDAFLEQVHSRLSSVTPSPSHPLTPASPLVGRGQCIEQYGKGEAYLPLLEALGDVGRGPGGEQCIAVLRQYAPTWLVQMPAFLSAAERETLQHTVAGATHERMLRELVEAVDALTAERPLVLWLEDLHWSDYSTVEWLGAVAQRRSAARLMVLATYRPTEVSLKEHPLRAMKRELQAHRQCAELVVQFLTPEDIAQYLAGRFAVGAIHESPLQNLAPLIHHRTEGNPLFMVNVVDYLVVQGTLTEIAGRWQLAEKVEDLMGHVPESLRQLIEKHLEELSAEEQRVLEVASVIGPEFSAAAVAAVVQLATEQVEECGEGLARRGHFLRALGPQGLPDGSVAGRYGFRHALYQTVLYERLGAARRIRVHRRVGEHEESLYGDRAREIAAELAVHFERGREYQKAVRYLGQAAKMPCSARLIRRR